MTSRIGRYQVLRRLGRGASGEVFLAHDPELGREVAVKVLRRGSAVQDERSFQRFLQEARLFARLDHEAVLPVLAAGLDQEPPFLVFPYLVGGDLAKEASRGPASRERVVHVGCRLASALDAVHAAGILHRDLKPENVLLDEAQHPFLADLGLGRVEGEATLTATGFVVGTPRYMAPEILEAGTYSRASDLYALGATLLVLSLGGHPGSPSELPAAAERIPDRGLRNVLRALLRVVPDARPKSGAAVIEALEAVAEQEPEADQEGATVTREVPLRPPDRARAREGEASVPATERPSPSLAGMALRLAAWLLAGELVGRMVAALAG